MKRCRIVVVLHEEITDPTVFFDKINEIVGPNGFVIVTNTEANLPHGEKYGLG